MGSALTTCGIFLYSRPTGRFLACHATNSRWTQWSIPKGLPAEGEEHYVAACRELFEEANIRIDKLTDPQVFPLTPAKYQKQNKVLQSFLIVTNDSFDKHVFKSTLAEGKNFPEVDSWKWITLDEGKKWVHESQSKLLSEIQQIIDRL
jgi:predicted NUDIX family NTP pyrophosphohydrolase